MSVAAKTVSKFEGRMVGLARAIVGLAPTDSALPFLLDKITIPPAFSPDCLQLTCDVLANGCVTYLAKVGGWRRERFLHHGRPVEGRLWDRIPVDERQLKFSRHVWGFLVWLTAQPPSVAKPWLPAADEVTVADQLFFFMAYSGFRDTEVGPAWRHRPLFARNPMCRLMWPEDFTSMSVHPPNFDGWGKGLAATILEAHQSPLAERWYAIDQEKSEITDWSLMRQLAEAQNLTLDQFLPAVDPHRRDLARFLVEAAARYCVPGVRAEYLTAGLTAARETRLADRFVIRREAAVLARTLVRLSAWERESRSAGFLDDGYRESQYFLTMWDAADASAAVDRARTLLRQLEPLGGGANEPSLSSERERVGTAVDSRDG